MERQLEWKKSKHELNQPGVLCQCGFCLKLELYSKTERDSYSRALQGSAVYSQSPHFLFLLITSVFTEKLFLEHPDFSTLMLCGRHAQLTEPYHLFTYSSL